ncbi:cytochrome c oxidase subunit 2 [Vibrio xiamenensis]|uniref:Cytochrome c oxidase subunit 2 n=2 Tax=Vibrio xiamenensis TaxID=861298 RepID=A0A1G8GW55_9VIBR|nr:cytochrome c oxidase subunit 2 [Vibrio xiamenensis]
MKNFVIRLWFLADLMLIGFAAPAISAEPKLNMTQGVTEISGRVYELHMLIFYICCAIAVVVFGAIFFSIVRHRKSRGAVAASFHESTKIEILWTLIPIVILILMAIPATKTLIAMEDTSQSDLTVQITGSQWKWHYRYFDQDVAFFSLLTTSQQQIQGVDEKGEHYLLEVDQPLVLPAHRKVRFLLTSDDVIHSWWVPDFAVKKDAIPGFINEAWTRVDKPGIYRGQCAELCGRAHGFMPVVVQVLEPEAFDTWLTDKKNALAEEAASAQSALSQTLSLEALMRQGEAVYLDRCAVCHQPTGVGIPGAFPAIKGSPVATGALELHLDTVLNGRAGTAMQAFANQLTEQEIAAVVTYQRNAWGNNTNDAVQAADVNAYKQRLEAVKEGQ